VPRCRSSSHGDSIFLALLIIATFASVGAEFGYSLLWVLIPIAISLGIVQEMCARMGAVTGKGLADLIRERFGVRWGNPLQCHYGASR